MYFHQNIVIETMKALGYKVNESGMCFGIANMSQQAFLTNQTRQFQDCLKTIKHFHGQSNYNFWSPIYLNIDTYAFADGITLYQDPNNYRYLFRGKAYLEQKNTKQQSKLLKPVILDNQKIIIPIKLIGAFTHDELVLLLRLLSTDIQTRFSLILCGNLGGGLHSIHLGYVSESRSWFFCDPNSLPGAFYNSSEEVAALIEHSFTRLVPDFQATRSRTVMSLEMNCLYQDHLNLSQKTTNFFANYKKFGLEKSSLEDLSLENIYPFFYTPIHLATYVGNLTLLKKVFNSLEMQLEKNEIQSEIFLYLFRSRQFNRVNPIGPNRITPLMLACENGHTRVVSLLLDILVKQGAQLHHLNSPDKDGVTPLYMACQNGHTRIVSLLLDALNKEDAQLKDLNPPDKDDKTPLFGACKYGHTKIVSLLLDALIKQGAQLQDLNSPLEDGWTPLMVACQNGHTRIVSLLLDVLIKQDAQLQDLNLPTKDGVTPLMIACQNGHIKIVSLLLNALNKQGAQLQDLNLPDKNGYTPLHLSCYNGHIKVIRLLILKLKEKKADFEQLNPKAKNGITPLELAKNNNHTQVLREYASYGSLYYFPEILGMSLGMGLFSRRENKDISPSILPAIMLGQAAISLSLTLLVKNLSAPYFKTPYIEHSLSQKYKEKYNQQKNENDGLTVSKMNNLK